MKIGIRNIVMPGARMHHDRGDEVDATEDRAEPGDDETHDPHVATDTGRVRRVRQRRVGVPAEVGGATRGQEAADGDEAAEQEQVEAEDVQPREGDVGRTDLQRHDDIGKADEQRRREQQQHDRAVHREQLVVLLVGEELQPGPGQFGAHQQRHDTGQQEEQERRRQVELADQLVVGGGHPVDERRAATLLRTNDGLGDACGGHVLLPDLKAAFIFARSASYVAGVTIFTWKSI